MHMMNVMLFMQCIQGFENSNSLQTKKGTHVILRSNLFSTSVPHGRNITKYLMKKDIAHPLWSDVGVEGLFLVK